MLLDGALPHTDQAAPYYDESRIPMAIDFIRAKSIELIHNAGTERVFGTTNHKKEVNLKMTGPKGDFELSGRFDATIKSAWHKRLGT